MTRDEAEKLTIGMRVKRNNEVLTIERIDDPAETSAMLRDTRRPSGRPLWISGRVRRRNGESYLLYMPSTSLQLLEETHDDRTKPAASQPAS